MRGVVDQAAVGRGCGIQRLEHARETLRYRLVPPTRRGRRRASIHDGVSTALADDLLVHQGYDESVPGSPWRFSMSSSRRRHEGEGAVIGHHPSVT